jgi:choline dehydrogenase-like flavoprotein
VRPALDEGRITLWTNTLARRLLTDSTGRKVVGLEIENNGEKQTVSADRYVISAGAVNTAVLLLRSANQQHPNGLANSSGQVGLNYMVHNNSALMAVNPFRQNKTVFQKTMAVNDFYFGSADFPYPMGNLQLLGKLQAGMLAASQPLLPQSVLQAMANRSVDWWIMSEDLPCVDNFVTVGANGRIQIHWKPSNRVAHEKLIAAAKRMMRRAGYPLLFVERMGIETNSHQCGTARFGHDPATSVLDPICKAHDLINLYIVDSSFFPSSAAMNPALTIAAQALRVAEHLQNN